MSTLSQLYSNIVTLMNQTFSKKTDVDTSISSHNSNSSAHSTEMAKKVNINQGNSNASKNVVTDSSGNITVEAKPTIPTKTSDLTNDSNYVTTTDSRLSDSRTPTSHTHGNVSNDGKIGTASGKLITTGTGGVLQASDSITKSMISDFPSTMTPASHTHGNITNDGKVGSTANKPLITTTNGAVTTGSFGTSANTFCQGNDSRLSDARTPTSHTHGSVSNDGKIGTASGKIITTGTNGVLQASDSITKSMISDFPSSMTPTSHTHTTGDVSDTSAYSNIGSSANATQKTINDKINTALGNKANSSNVYTKSETYTQAEITTAIGNAVGNLTLFEIVTALPTTNIKNNRLYLVANNKSIESNTYDIYLRVNNTWEKLDSLEFDIANYYNKTETDTLLSGKVDTSDSRLTDSRTPKSHTHGNITNTGAIGSTANLPIITTTSGKLTTGSFGTSANTFCQGNDSRLSNSRTPTSHASTATTYGVGTTANYGHVKTINGLTQSSHTDGTALSAYQGKVLKDLVDGKASSSHSHTVSNITDFPSIPSKTSDLTNDSGFLTSHQDISGKIDTAGTGLSKSGTTLNHSNSITAVTTAAFKKIKYDAQGHITGTADVTASDLPSHTHSDYALTSAIPTNNNQLTNGAGYITSSSLPTSTSDLTNDGEDGTNPFVSDDDSRLSDARTPTSHTHGNLTNDGKVGSTANYFVYTTTGGAITSKQKIGNITTSGAIGSTSGLPLKTTTSGVITTGSFGTTSGTFCQGNDSRLHSHTFTYSNGSLTIS